MEELYRREEAVDAEHYASNIQQLLNSFQQTYYTSEKLLNIILNDKVQQMRRAGIREDVRIGEIDLSFMREIDITALFGNLLDNAVASAEECNGFIISMSIWLTAPLSGLKWTVIAYFATMILFVVASFFFDFNLP